MTSDILVALVVLGVIIVIHELGHFLVAKFFSIRVETFSVGFGPRLIGFRRGDTDYRISALPLGGYVKMSGENPTDSLTGAPHEFLSKPKWQRFLVAAAGPAMNVVLAVVLLTGLYMYGTDVPEFSEGQATVGVVEPNSPAAQGGVQVGDRVVEFNGRVNPNWQDIESQVLTSPGRPLPVVLDRGGQSIEAVVTPVREGPSETGFIGMGPQIRVVIRRVLPDSPAEVAGLQAGDEIVSVNGIALRTPDSMPKIVQEIAETTFPIQIRRTGEVKEVQVTTMIMDGRKMIGVDFALPTVNIKLGFFGSLQRSIATNIQSASLIFEVLGKLFTREVSMKAVDGPIGIVRVTGQFFDVGFGPLIALMALISLNLGLMNLLPIPILDGGVMLMLIVEGLMGRDLSMRMKERIVQVSFVFLVTLMVFVLYNDVVKLLPKSQLAP